jgi:hypothetical protein
MVASALGLGGCWQSFVHDETLDGPYRLVAVDVMDDMVLCWSAPDDHEVCSEDGLPGGKVVAAGANKRFVVAARRPNLAPFGEPPRFGSNIEYYYVIRTADEAVRPPEPKQIIGPLTGNQFAGAKRSLGLPDFSRKFDDIE